jgi:transglutaminase-like putative cysteine protease
MLKIGLFALLGAAAGVAHAEDRRLVFEYRVDITGVKPGQQVDVYVPMAQDSARQTILRTDLVATIDGAEKTESRYGNRYWHGHVDAASGEDVSIVLTHVIERRDHGVDKPTEAERSLFLQPNARVPVDGPLVQGVRAEIGIPQDASAVDKARAIYDYVVANVEYRKNGPGWGNGDTEWACTKKYGNCTDFHALFTSLARAEGLPARFEIGFAVAQSPEAGTVEGYHCWIEVALPGVGWFPVDASEASKHPEKKDALFGAQPADRIRFTVGRDLVLDGQQAPPLNYMVYPHVEVAGKVHSEVKTRFSYRPATAEEAPPSTGQSAPED